MSIRLLIGDDHAIVREGLKQIIEDTVDLEVVAEAASGGAVLDAVRKNSYDVIVLDISLPDQSGLDILKQIKHIKPDLPVLMLSIHPEELYAVRVLRAGAAGYITKRSAPGELVTAIRTVAQGRKYITSSLAEHLAQQFDDITQPPHELLSDREYQVMIGIANGKSVSEIANDLSLSVNTISTYRSRILEKMRLKNNADIIHYAIQYGLVEA